MKLETFADILKDKIEKLNTNTPRSAFDSSYQPLQGNPCDPSMTSELATFQTQFQNQMLGQSPRLFQSALRYHDKFSPYVSHRTSTKNSEGISSKPLRSDTHSKPLTHEINKKKKERVRTSAHILNAAQSQAMSYFILEKMFLFDDFTLDELKTAYKTLALKKHPDLQAGSNEFFTELKKNYETLRTIPTR